ncbi:MAG: hypothetical protein HY359_03585 [Candidatus Rokubacteria bacterium]|nr:hypothetical protein [Candidatus Rokubacteria bacterium]
MTTPLSRSELLAALEARARQAGLTTRPAGEDGLEGAVESIRAKWLLGGRKVTYRTVCRLDEPSRTVRCREAVVETSWGVPPPTLTVEKTTVRGWERSGSRTDRSVGGGGAVDYGTVREALRQAVTDAGWQFQIEGGRKP